MFFNPIISIVRDTTRNRFHPIVFAESPLPGDSQIIRHKSKMHHTGGFDTREAAVQNITADLVPKIPGAQVEIEADFEWDGEVVPAIVHFFTSQN